MGSLHYIESTPLSKHLGRYSDKYMNKAMLDALYNRILCYDCGEMMFQYDPEDHDYRQQQPDPVRHDPRLREGAPPDRQRHRGQQGVAQQRGVDRQQGVEREGGRHHQTVRHLAGSPLNC